MYQGGIEDTGDNKRYHDIDDDFIAEDDSGSCITKKAKFSYGTSPGFKQ